ncbi:MAG: hypothetical protein P1S60_15140 [Anaerolineae bacterium]|nr:hypothetical protein [Anaerolineae bacterium]
MNDNRSRHRPAFGKHRIYYNNFAAHLLNAYNPNMLYPDLPYRWTDADWKHILEMVRGFGFNTFQFWLVPHLFCREGIDSEYGKAFIQQMTGVIDYAHALDLQVDMLCSLATVGSQWHTLCPNMAEEWQELRFLWDAWAHILPVDRISIFPGDPGACSRNGCTAVTFIDKALEIAQMVKGIKSDVKIVLHTWGPPFFGWGNVQGPPGWRGEFVQSYQHTAWTFDRARMERSMAHLLERLPDFPQPATVAINLGFNPDGIPEGESNAVPWAKEIAKTHAIETWDFSLTEGENAILPHYRFQRLFSQRQRERVSAPYSGGICFTMTPLLNQLSLYESAQSFINPDASPENLAVEFYEMLYGSEGRAVVPFLPLFEVIPDWGNYHSIKMPRSRYHQAMVELTALLHGLQAQGNEDFAFHPSPEYHRQELFFYADLFSKLSGQSPAYEDLEKRYWNKVYHIYDYLPAHVDPRPHRAVDNLIKRFAEWK